ncbi:MAG: Sec-independent protein translocase subunit TatA [Mycobacteriales bacterium]
MNLPNGWELVLVVVVGILLFGSKKLPGAARSLGQSLRIFKAETKGLREDYKDGLDGKEDAALRRGEIEAEPTIIAAPGRSSQPVGVPLSDLDQREEELRRREDVLRREEELRQREEALRRETESR